MGDAATTPSAPRATGADPAYLLYTSGSTGPKGVLVGHAALTQLVGTVHRAAGATFVERVLATTTTTFDISLVELLLPVTTGATCVLADEDTVRDPMRLAEYIAAGRIDFAQATPTLWGALLEHLQVRIPVTVCAGEPLGGALRDRLLAASGYALNGYGPTETTVYATLWPLAEGVPVSIGAPIAGTTAWVLDCWNRPCATGAVGGCSSAGPGCPRATSSAPSSLRRSSSTGSRGHPRPGLRHR
ncbi:AMP-binding protein [Kitasatospora gansuensis]